MSEDETSAEDRSSGQPFRGLDVTFDLPTGVKLPVKVSGSRVRGVAREASLVLLSFEPDARQGADP